MVSWDSTYLAWARCTSIDMIITLTRWMGESEVGCTLKGGLVQEGWVQALHTSCGSDMCQLTHSSPSQGKWGPWVVALPPLHTITASGRRWQGGGVQDRSITNARQWSSGDRRRMVEADTSQTQSGHCTYNQCDTLVVCHV